MVQRTLTVKVDVTWTKGQHALKLYVICDSYNDISLSTVAVAEGEDINEDMESGLDA